jgi:hypothetical protein
MPPLLLTFIAIILYVGGWILFLSRIGGLRNEFRLFSTADRNALTLGARTTIPVMSGIGALCVMLVLALNISAGRNSLDNFSPPQDFGPLAELDLSARAYSNEPLAQFSLDEPANVGVFVVIRNIDTPYFDLSMTGPNGYSSIIMHGEGYSAYQDGGLWEKNLSPGTYQIVLTSHQSPGTASVFLKIR